MMESYLMSINSVNIANYLFIKFFSASLRSSLSSPAESTAHGFKLSAMCFHSSREAASNVLLSLLIYIYIYIFIAICS